MSESKIVSWKTWGVVFSVGGFLSAIGGTLVAPDQASIFVGGAIFLLLAATWAFSHT